MPANPEGTIHGWNSYAPIFEVLIKATQPKTIIEVGSWRGASAIHMLTLCDAKIYCVDTWEGSEEHQGSLPRDGNGRITLRDEFDANVQRAGFADRVVPLQMRSAAGAELLASLNVLAELVYIDGSHAEQDVAADLRAYWPLVKPGGIMFGDDWNEWPSVRRAVEAFGKPSTDQNHWWFTKPASG